MSKRAVDSETPVPSQRSIVRAAEVADEIQLSYRARFAETAENGPLLNLDAKLSDLWWKLLYQNDFEDWMVTHAKDTFKFQWLKVLVALRNRNQSFFYSYGIPSRRHSSAMLSSPRNPSNTIRTFSSDEYFFRVFRRISRTRFSVDTFSLIRSSFRSFRSE